MARNFDVADFVLMVCTATYRHRVMGLEEPGEGLGVRWEGRLIYNRIAYGDPAGSRFIPILLPGSEPAHIPNPILGHSYYRFATFDLTDPGYEALYRHLTGQPATPRPDLGPIQLLPEAATASRRPGRSRIGPSRRACRAGRPGPYPEFHPITCVPGRLVQGLTGAQGPGWRRDPGGELAAGPTGGGRCGTSPACRCVTPAG